VVVLFALDRGRWALAGLGEGAWAPAALALGLALGIAVQGASALAMAFTGVVEPAGVAWSWPTGSVLLLGVAGTLVDAFLLRGYVIGLVAARAGQVTAVAVTMLVAVVMAASGGSPTLMDAATAAATAAFLGALRLRTGSLAAAWLAHLAIETIADGMGGDALPAVTAGLLALVSFLLFVLRPRTDGPGRA
jgi:membrane protease YdiL (CAAX protease family)